MTIKELCEQLAQYPNHLEVLLNEVEFEQPQSISAVSLVSIKNSRNSTRIVKYETIADNDFVPQPPATDVVILLE
jgi:hypothetical protein